MILFLNRLRLTPLTAAEELEERLSFINPPSERRRAHSVRVTSQRELLQEAGWKNLNQTPLWLGSSTAIHQGNSASNMSTLNPTGVRRGRSNSLMGDLKVIKGQTKAVTTKCLLISLLILTVGILLCPQLILLFKNCTSRRSCGVK